jgi:hypothetical protein
MVWTGWAREAGGQRESHSQNDTRKVARDVRDMEEEKEEEEEEEKEEEEEEEEEKEEEEECWPRCSRLGSRTATRGFSF